MEKRNAASRLLIFVSLLFLLAMSAAEYALHTKAAVKLSRTKLVLTVETEAAASCDMVCRQGVSLDLEIQQYLP